MAFVIVTHLNPDRESHLATVLARLTDMTVKTAEDGDRLRADTVYVMPESSVLLMENARLRLKKASQNSRERKPIDVFFSSLGEDQKDNAAAIVLSGGDGDGTLGVKVVKEYGGVTLAQTADGEPPLNPEMPQSAIATGFADFAIPARQMIEKLMEIRNGRATLDALAVSEDSDEEANPSEVQSVISEILRIHSGHDFSGYKSKTFFRRVARRMHVRQVADLNSYCELLREDGEEVTALFRDLLISVTNFFRDDGAFEALENTVIPHLFDNRDSKAPVRIWVPACTTGEEVYSLAILACERMEKSAPTAQVQIFATDIDDHALAVARQGRYPEQLLRNVSPRRLARHFHKDGAGYVVSKKIREMCIFSPHNVISDPPFSRMDLVSCRNLLIYFGPELQRQVIPTFHYALKPGGFLFLGTSESISQFADLFETLDKKNRIFRALGKAGRRWSPSGPVSKTAKIGLHPPGADRPAGIHLRHRVERHILDNHTPAHVVVRDDGDILFSSGGTGGLLEMPRGAPTHNLFEMIPREMRLELRSLLRQSAETGQPAERRNLLIGASPDGKRLNLKVEPLRDGSDNERLFIVFFQSAAPDQEEVSAAVDSDRLSETAEQELHEMRERLQSTVEEYETALEELKSSNEELVSVNEEAQSTNEELEASKEEMQSLNEELNTINAELNSKIDELDRVNADLRNLFDATQIATVFLDSDLVIRSFTPAAGDLFNLREADLGRPLTELASVSRYPNLQTHIRAVFETGDIYEHRLSDSGDETQYLVRVTPYLARNDGVDGAVVTLIDVTTLARAEAQQKVLIAELNHRVKNMLAVITVIVKTSLSGKGVPQDVLNTLIDRLKGMARAYELLSASTWSSVGVRAIVQQELEAFARDRAHISGPNVDLPPTQALSFSMVIHELATNAAKYGALSDDRGRLNVSWKMDEDQLALEWVERGGPPIEEPEQTGFGFVLVKGQIEQQLGGKLETSFNAEGLIVRLAFPL